MPAAAATDMEETNDKTPLLGGGRGGRQTSSGSADDVFISTAADSCCHREGPFRKYGSLAVLTVVNLLNYMDRVTIAGVLVDVKKYYNINDAWAGALQSSFVISYMIFSPLFGYLGDRFSRKYIMTGGILFWSAVTLGSSFVASKYFPVFLLTRALVGVGEASYSTVAPSVLADLFVNKARTRVLAIFYFAIPVGSGLGYMIGSSVAEAIGAWQWSLRVTPCLGFVCVVLIVFVVVEPERGAAEGSTRTAATSSSWLSDLTYLAKNKSFVYSTLGFTCVTFVTGGLSFWAPLFVIKAASIQGSPQSDASISLIFGVITVVSGFGGVAIGTQSAMWLKRKTPDADPLVCGIGLIAGAPFLFGALVTSRYNISATWVGICIAETLLFFNSALITDILLYVIIPARRSTAQAVQILFSHLLGDAGSPYLIGMISDQLRASGNDDYTSLQYALYMSCFLCVVGGGFFFATTLYVVRDKRAVTQFIEGLANERPSQNTIQAAAAATMAVDVPAVDAQNNSSQPTGSVV